MRKDSILAKGVEKHINAYCEKHGIQYRYADMDRWMLEGDEYGEPVTAEWLRRRFKKADGKLVTRPTMDKWIILRAKEKDKQNEK
jgi:hypothetical protein